MIHRGLQCTLFVLLLSLISLLHVNRGVAQIGIGGGLDIRSEDPSRGYSLRVEYRIFNLPPVVDLKLRAHGSYFYENRMQRYENHGLVSDVYEEEVAFDAGVAALAGVNLGVLSPYAGAGLGIDSSQFVAVRSSSDPGRKEGINEENLFWNLFFGTEFKLIPYINPFFEYRFIQLVNPRNIDFRRAERFSVGAVFRF